MPRRRATISALPSVLSVWEARIWRRTPSDGCPAGPSTAYAVGPYRAGDGLVRFRCKSVRRLSSCRLHGTHVGSGNSDAHVSDQKRSGAPRSGLPDTPPLLLQNQEIEALHEPIPSRQGLALELIQPP